MNNNFLTDNIIKNALREDIGTGDITTLSTIPYDKHISGKLIAKESGVICGALIAKRVFELVDSEANTEIYFSDGAFVENGTVIAKVSGRAQSVLTGERVALNFFQRLSGIATHTRKCVDAVKTTKAMIT
ncbi:MAG: nicotinate-nucleotide diphosphorylase (carboxylating), partial [Candidatus Moranbacteria bacterium]|nr:nicotinate-nucleotide diphosphorylase (carboxylating) [Candidatus Moranbacteria bacterium]